MDKLKVIEYEYPNPGGAIITIKYMGGGWAIFRDCHYGSCWNKRGEWEIQPQPSSRTEEFYQRNRYETVEEAVKVIETTLIKTRRN